MNNFQRRKQANFTLKMSVTKHCICIILKSFIRELNSQKFCLIKEKKKKLKKSVGSECWTRNLQDAENHR